MKKLCINFFKIKNIKPLSSKNFKKKMSKINKDILEKEKIYGIIGTWRVRKKHKGGNNKMLKTVGDVRERELD